MNLLLTERLLEAADRVPPLAAYDLRALLEVAAYDLRALLEVAADTIIRLEEELVAVGDAYEDLQAECEKLRKDVERLEWIVSERAIVAHAGARGEPHRYWVEWPLLGEVGVYRFASERDAIDAAMQEEST